MARNRLEKRVKKLENRIKNFQSGIIFGFIGLGLILFTIFVAPNMGICEWICRTQTCTGVLQPFLSFIGIVLFVVSLAFLMLGGIAICYAIFS